MMNEKKFIFWWYDRFDTVNKGILRILAVTTLPVAGYFIGSGLFLFGYLLLGLGPESSKSELILATVKLITLGIGGYVAFWTLFRGALWIFDGFKEN